MDVGADLIAYSLNHYDQNKASSAADINALCTTICQNFSGTRSASPFEYGIFCGLIFGGFIKYGEKLGKMDEERKNRVKILTDTAVGALGGVAPVLPAAAIFAAGGVTLVGDVVTTYLMKQRILRGASLKLIGRFLAAEHRAVASSTTLQQFLIRKESWREIKDGLDLSLLCTGL